MVVREITGKNYDVSDTAQRLPKSTRMKRKELSSDKQDELSYKDVNVKCSIQNKQQKCLKLHDRGTLQKTLPPKLVNKPVNYFAS